jgi:hypothetical protein
MSYCREIARHADLSQWPVNVVPAAAMALGASSPLCILRVPYCVGPRSAAPAAHSGPGPPSGPKAVLRVIAETGTC